MATPVRKLAKRSAGCGGSMKRRQNTTKWRRKWEAHKKNLPEQNRKEIAFLVITRKTVSGWLQRDRFVFDISDYRNISKLRLWARICHAASNFQTTDRNKHIVGRTNAWFCIDPNFSILCFRKSLRNEKPHPCVAHASGWYIRLTIQGSKYAG